MKRIADLFCGAGGTSTGILQACAALHERVDLLAVNHWTTAINTHSLNCPGVRHICETLDNVHPREAVGGRGRLDLLAASPECTYHSVAAGGRPKNDQSRATAWHVCRWAADLTVENLLIENVCEFQNWGPLGSNGQPLKSRKGETFRAFIQALRSMGFTVEWREVVAADYGDATSRRRLIILGRRGKPIVWPEPTYGSPDLFRTGLKPYRSAREIIDWQLKGKSIFRRKRPLSPNTIRRIAAGLRKFGGANAEPFLVMLYGTNDARSVDRPMPTVTSGGHIALAEPFVLNLSHGESDSLRSVDEPVPTITTARGGELAMVEPFMTHLTHHGTRRQHSIDDPCPTITGAHRGELALIEPKAFILGQQSCASPRSTDEPLPTICTDGAIALCEPFLVKYYGTGGANSINTPLDTITTKDRFLLVEPKSGRAVAELDILFRMLKPHELAAAMSFPSDYKFTGNVGDQVKQIGNAVPVQLARAHAMALLS
jgi:DNA (cytosine-5)-methyltransferase 1